MTCENDTSFENTSISKDQLLYENVQWTMGLVIIPLTCIPGLFANVAIIIVFGRKNMKTSTNVYLTALAVSDFLKLFNDLLYFMVVLFKQIDINLHNTSFVYMYPYAHFIFAYSTCVSAILTVSVAVERYLLVCHPAKSKSWTSIRQAKIISTLVYILFIVIDIPLMLRYKQIECHYIRMTTLTALGGGGGATAGNRSNFTKASKLIIVKTKLWEVEKFEKAMNLIQALIRSIIPFFILAIMNFFIIKAVHKTRANKKLASRNRITTMLIIVILFFLLCICPDAIMSSIFGYAEETYKIRAIREFTDYLLCLNSSINFFLYFYFNNMFRKQFLITFYMQRFISTNCVTNENEQGDFSRKETVVNYSPCNINETLSDVEKSNENDKLNEDKDTCV